MKRKLMMAMVTLGLMMVALVGPASANTGKTPAEPGAQPWMVGLLSSDTNNGYDAQFCGGSLIAPNWVLTAAHCVEGIQNASEVDILVGRHTLSSNEGERITAAEIAVHKGYPDDADGEDNDIALIRLSRPATQGTPIKLAATTATTADDPGAQARVTGWGSLTEAGGDEPDTLHGVNLPVVSQEACKAVYGEDLLSDTICAGPESGGADSCYGDSGGPLVGRNSSGEPVQIGVVSWGDECGAAGQYGVYARVTSYQNWINNVLNGTADTLTPAELPASSEGGDWDEGDWDDDSWDDDSWDDGSWDDDSWDDGDWGDDSWDDGSWDDDSWDDGSWGDDS